MDLLAPKDETEKEGCHGARPCDQMMSYADHRPLALSVMDVSALLDQSVDYYMSLVPRNVRFVCRFGVGVESVWARVAETQLRRLLTNLMTNAIEAIEGQDGLIVLQMSRRRVRSDEGCFLVGETIEPGEYISISVENSGPRIAPEHLDRIFDPDFTTRSAGRGLGLTEALGWARGMHGAIAVHNRDDSPVSFELLLPSVRELDPPAVPPEQTRGTVLVMDDNEGVRTFVEAQLQQAGYQVLLAADGEAGLEILRTKRDEVDVVIADFAMPRLGGLEVIRSVQKLNLDIPVLLMTGLMDLETVACLNDLPVAGYVVKPVAPEQLLRQLSGVFAKLRIREPAHVH